MNVVPFKKEHLPGREPQWLDMVSSCGPSLTGLDGDKVIFCIGLIIVKPGVAEAWIDIPDRDLVRSLPHARFIFTGSAYWLAYFIKDLSLRRVAAWVRCDQPSHVKWIEKLGFSREGIMRKFDRDGADCYLYARIRENGNGH